MTENFRPATIHRFWLLLVLLGLSAPLLRSADQGGVVITKVGATYLDEQGNLRCVFPGKYNLLMLLDREYAALGVSIKGEQGYAGYVLRPHDGNSSANLLIGKPRYPKTDEALMKSPGFTRFEVRDVDVSGQPVRWRQWSDAQHLYSDAEFKIAVTNGAADETLLIHVDVVANSAERRAALEDKLVLTRAVIPRLPVLSDELTRLVKSLPVDYEKWRLIDASAAEIHWLDEADDEVVLGYMESAELRAVLEDVQTLREYWRMQAASDGGGIISSEVVRGRRDVIKHALMVAKYPLSNHGWGYQIVALVPMGNGLARVAIRSRERGVIGFRETLAMVPLVQGKKPEEIKKIADHYFRDPYDPRYDAGAKYALSDEPKWDRGFPDHPLSKCRRVMAHYLSALEALK